MHVTKVCVFVERSALFVARRVIFGNKGFFGFFAKDESCSLRWLRRVNVGRVTL